MNNFFCSSLLFQLDNVTVPCALRIKVVMAGIMKKMRWVNADLHASRLQSLHLDGSLFFKS